MTFKQLPQWQIYDPTGRRKYLSNEEREQFLRAADTLAPSLRALCYVLVFTGCRISEALSLNRHQLDAQRMTLTVSTLKRRRIVFRAIPVPRCVTTMLSALPGCPDGRFWTMHRSTAWRCIKQVMKSVNIAGPMATCKGLRHGFGIRAAGRNVPPNLIQRWMGHASPTTTAIYLDAVGVEERRFAIRMW
jgi:integrase